MRFLLQMVYLYFVGPHWSISVVYEHTTWILMESSNDERRDGLEWPNLLFSHSEIDDNIWVFIIFREPIGTLKLTGTMEYDNLALFWFVTKKQKTVKNAVQSDSSSMKWKLRLEYIYFLLLFIFYNFGEGKY